MRVRLAIFSLVFLVIISKTYADTIQSKITPDITISYSSVDGIKYIHVQVSAPEQDQLVPVPNMIVNLSLTKRRKYNPLRAEGWMGNRVTNSNGIAEFTLPEQAYKLRPDRHEFEFIANLGTDPLYRDTEARLKTRDVFFRFKFMPLEERSSVLVKLSRAQGKEEVVMPNADFELFLNDSVKEYKIGSGVWTSDEQGERTIVLEQDILDLITPGAFITAKYMDAANNGEVIVHQKLPDEMYTNTGFGTWMKWSRKHLSSVLVFIGSAVALFLILFYLRRTKQS